MVKCLNEMIYYNFVSNLLVQDCTGDTCAKLLKRKQLVTKLDFTPDGWTKINVDAYYMVSTIGYVVKDKRGNTTIAEGEQIADCLIIVVEAWLFGKLS